MPIRFNHKPGLVIYLTAGDPSLDATRAIAIAAIDAGADVIELGVPFSDPMADGPVIQRASERALAHGTSLKNVLALAGEIRAARPAAGVILFSYFNPILRYGLRQFADDAKAAGADGALVTDLIVEEAGEYLTEMKRVGLAPVFLAAPTSPDERLEAIATHSQGLCLRHLPRRSDRQAEEPGLRCCALGGASPAMDPAADRRGLRHQ
jgi:tryptophan synthase alpha chain